MLYLISFVIEILIGALVGWLAGLVMKSKGGFWKNAIMGILGGIIGGFLPFGIIGSILGACLVIFVYEKYVIKTRK